MMWWGLEMMDLRPVERLVKGRVYLGLEMLTEGFWSSVERGL